MDLHYLPAFQTLCKFLGSADGRDKVVKVLQYGSRAATYNLTRRNAKTNWLSVLPKIEGAATSSRKMFRIGKSINVLMKILKNNERNPNIRALSTLGDLGLAWFFLFDNLGYLSTLGVLKYQPRTMLRTAASGWLVSLLVGLAVDARQLLIEKTLEKRLQEKLRVLLAKLEVVHSGAEGQESAKAVDAEVAVVRNSLKNNRIKQQVLILALIKNLADLQIARTNSLGFWKSSPGVLGVCGVISGAISAYQVWRAL